MAQSSICFTAGLLLSASTAFANNDSTLETFEKNGTKSPERSAERQEDRSSRDGEETKREGRSLERRSVNPWFDLMGQIIAGGGRHSLERVLSAEPALDDTADYELPRNSHREGGEAVIPFVRIDASHQWINSRIHATDTRVELGYGPLGVEFRKTLYAESDPNASLEVRQYHGLYRMSLGDNLEMDIGYGKFELYGVKRHSGGSWTLPVQIHPTPNFGIEYRPAWTTINGNDIADYELALSAGARFLGIRAGYRWMKSPGVTIDGAFLGISGRI